jgi:hypothetical protein
MIRRKQPVTQPVARKFLKDLSLTAINEIRVARPGNAGGSQSSAPDAGSAATLAKNLVN